MSEEIILKTILTIILLPITLLHIYWAFDGKIALDGAWPTDLSQINQKLSSKTFFIIKFLLLLPVILVLICLIASFYIVPHNFIIDYQTLYMIFSLIFICIIIFDASIFHSCLFIVHCNFATWDIVYH